MNVAQPCLFLDRDGVIIKNVPYSRDPDTVEILPGAASLIVNARAKGFLVIVVTNQSGVGRGLMSAQDYENITARMLEYLDRDGATIDRIYHAPYYAESVDPRYREQAHWRKPEIGMIQQACLDFKIDLSRSILIGDRASDIQTAIKAGIHRKILVDAPDYPEEAALVPRDVVFEHAQSLREVQL